MSSISFAPTVQGGTLSPTVKQGNTYALGAYDPSAATGSGTATVSSIANAGGWFELARFSQWTVASGGATNWGTRFVVFAGTNGGLSIADLAVASGASRPATPAAATTLPGGISASSICPDVVVLDDYVNAANSIAVFRNPGPVLPDCGSADDEFYPVILGGGTQPGGSTSATMSWTEPVEAVRSVTGAITKILSVVHPTGTSNYSGTGAPLVAPTLQISNPDLTGAIAIGTPSGGGINGSGVNASGGVRDFQSLGILTTTGTNAGTYWVYRDLGSLMVATLGGSSPASVEAYGSSTVSSVIGPAQGPLYADASNLYVALNGSGGGAVLAVSLASLGTAHPSATVLVQETGQVALAGITPTRAIYWLKDGSAVKSVALAGGAATTLSTAAVTGSQLVSGTFGIAPPVVVSFGSSAGVYFNVCDCAAFSAPPQVWFSDGSAAATRVQSGGAPVNGWAIGGILPASVPIGNGTPAFSSVVVINTVGTIASPAAFTYAGAGLSEYGANGAKTFDYGAFGVQANSGVTFDTAVLASGVVQSGMPAVVQGSGSTNNGNAAQDLWQLTPGTAGSLVRVTSRLQ